MFRLLAFASHAIVRRTATVEIPNHVQEHVETIAKHEQAFIASRSTAERLADSIAGFAGSFSFVLIHVGAVAVWIVLNTSGISPIPHFDPSPFPLLGTGVALEAILLASFILMRQSGLAKRADERDHLMLQILLLAEKELSAVVRMNQQIAEHVGLPSVSKDQEIQKLGQPTSIDEVAQSIQDSLSRHDV
jgi:uncharacterized membrane protein